MYRQHHRPIVAIPRKWLNRGDESHRIFEVLLGEKHIKMKHVPTFAITGVVLTVLIGTILLAQQDRYTLKVPDGLAFSDFEGHMARCRGQ